MFERVVCKLCGVVRRRVAVARSPIESHGAVTCRREHSGVRGVTGCPAQSSPPASLPQGGSTPASSMRRRRGLPQLHAPVLLSTAGEKPWRGFCPSSALPGTRRDRTRGAAGAGGAGGCGAAPRERRVGQPAPRGGQSEVSVVFKENRSASVIKRMFSLIVAHIKEEDSHLLCVLLCRFQFRSYPLISLSLF